MQLPESVYCVRPLPRNVRPLILGSGGSSHNSTSWRSRHMITEPELGVAMSQVPMKLTETRTGLSRRTGKQKKKKVSQFTSQKTQAFSTTYPLSTLMLRDGDCSNYLPAYMYKRCRPHRLAGGRAQLVRKQRRLLKCVRDCADHPHCLLGRRCVYVPA